MCKHKAVITFPSPSARPLRSMTFRGGFASPPRAARAGARPASAPRAAAAERGALAPITRQEKIAAIVDQRESGLRDAAVSSAKDEGRWHVEVY